MTYLLDTQTLIWALENNPRLSPKAAKLITDGTNSLRVSIASLWEMAIKSSIKKLELTQPLYEIIRRLPEMDISILAIHPDHVLEVEKLPLHHVTLSTASSLLRLLPENWKSSAAMSSFLFIP